MKYTAVSLALCLSLYLTSTAHSQTQSGDLEAYLQGLLDDLPGRDGNDYNIPSAGDLLEWENLIRETHQGNLASARSSATSLGYEVVEFQHMMNGSSELYHVLKEKAPQSKYWGTYVFHPSACRPKLVLQAPHSQFDSNTGKEAIYCFLRLSAGTLFLSGAHRCNHLSYSSCDGSTSVCDDQSSSYRISDVAHATESAFQRTTQVLAEEIPNSIFIQLHGFSKRSSDPYVIMSNGTRSTPAEDYATQLSVALKEEDPVLTFKLAHIDQSWTRLIAFTNTQGRWLNESTDACNSSPTGTSGRFLHIEQERDRLRANQSGWDKMYRAMDKTFACQSPTNTMTVSTPLELKLYPNPVRADLIIEADQIMRVSVHSLDGKQLWRGEYDRSAIVKLKRNPQWRGLFLIKVNTQQLSTTEKIYFY